MLSGNCAIMHELGECSYSSIAVSSSRTILKSKYSCNSWNIAASKQSSTRVLEWRGLGRRYCRTRHWTEGITRAVLSAFGCMSWRWQHWQRHHKQHTIRGRRLRAAVCARHTLHRPATNLKRSGAFSALLPRQHTTNQTYASPEMGMCRHVRHAQVMKC